MLRLTKLIDLLRYELIVNSFVFFLMPLRKRKYIARFYLRYKIEHRKFIRSKLRLGRVGFRFCDLNSNEFLVFNSPYMYFVAQPSSDKDRKNTVKVMNFIDEPLQKPLQVLLGIAIF
jgi:hypothetical protein